MDRGFYVDWIHREGFNMTLWRRNIFRTTDPSRGIRHQWIIIIKGSIIQRFRVLFVVNLNKLLGHTEAHATSL